MPEATVAQKNQVDAFIARWERAEAAERANYQMFLTELCALLDIPKPDVSESNNAFNRYVFDRAIIRRKPDGSQTTVYADLYKRGCFILETKQGANAKQDNPAQMGLPVEEEAPVRKSGHGIRGTRQWDLALEKAYNQARGYIRDLPASEGRPPFLIVCDVGYVIELYSEFTCTGGTYVRFPDPKNHRIHLEDLRDPAIRQRLCMVWEEPQALDPAKHAARVTREVAEHLARLAKSLEANGHDAQSIATFLQRCLFTLFAEDVGLLPENSFTELLRKVREHPEGFMPLVNQLWKDMAAGVDYSTVLLQKIAHFNGGLFEAATALPLDGTQIALLLGAAKPDWSDVEPAIFGTLLERALSPQDRHKLGAHYTPRSYVERLVKPTVIDPLRSQWEAVKTAAAQFQEQGKAEQAVAAVKDFHHHLCRVQVLDPACGSGNFLYVTLEHMKRLEGEVLELLETLGDPELTFEMEQFKVRPQQFHGLELNERAVAIAQLVLWIGYFQWHKKTTGTADTKDRPLLPKQQTILRQDAVLAYDEKTPRKDENNNFVCIWDGRTTKPHPVTGKEVPDESVTIPVYDYSNPRRAKWPTFKKDEPLYIVGNPPFIGVRKMIPALGEGYVEALREAYPDLPDTIDFVMYWWHLAAILTQSGKCERFGLITTNSITQGYNYPVLASHLDTSKSKLHLEFAISDHPWVDTVDGAAVRISMTTAAPKGGIGILGEITSEYTQAGEQDGKTVILDYTLGNINPKLRIGTNINTAVPLKSNDQICFQGVVPAGDGFKLTPNEAQKLDQSFSRSKFIKPYIIGKDLVQTKSERFIIDLFGQTEGEVQNNFPELYQHLKDRVYPMRQQNRRKSYKENWWLFAETRPALRKAVQGLKRFICTPYTAKHRPFIFVDGSTIPDAMAYAIIHDDSYMLGVLSSALHGLWSRLAGGTLEDRPRYNSKRTFFPFPFPDLAEDAPLKAGLRELGEQLDAHRKKQQATHPELTMTGMYNVLEKLRREEALTEKDKKMHDDGLVSVLKHLHDEIDAATAEAYGWQDLLSDKPLADRLAQGDEALEQQILQRLVDLNHERAAEEANGKIRWLRPEYQCPEEAEDGGQKTEQGELPGTETQPKTGKLVTEKLNWPKTLPEQVATLRSLLPETGPDPNTLAAHFGKRTKKRVQEIDQILETLRNLGQL